MSTLPTRLAFQSTLATLNLCYYPCLLAVFLLPWLTVCFRRRFNLLNANANANALKRQAMAKQPAVIISLFSQAVELLNWLEKSELAPTIKELKCFYLLLVTVVALALRLRQLYYTYAVSDKTIFLRLLHRQLPIIKLL